MFHKKKKMGKNARGKFLLKIEIISFHPSVPLRSTRLLRYVVVVNTICFTKNANYKSFIIVICVKQVFRHFTSSLKTLRRHLQKGILLVFTDVRHDYTFL